MTDHQQTLGEAVDRLAQTVAARRGAAPDASYTAKLLSRGPAHCAKKLGEEGVELALAVAAGSEKEIADEAADLLYHMMAALAARGVEPAAVAAALAAREGVSGLDEKASRTE